jgi:hypothetical protein
MSNPYVKPICQTGEGAKNILGPMLSGLAHMTHTIWQVISESRHWMGAEFLFPIPGISQVYRSPANCNSIRLRIFLAALMSRCLRFSFGKFVSCLRDVCLQTNDSVDKQTIALTVMAVTCLPQIGERATNIVEERCPTTLDAGLPDAGSPQTHTAVILKSLTADC